MILTNLMSPKVTWVVVGIVGVVGLGYLASRVGNIGARGVRDGATSVSLEFSTPISPGREKKKVTWNTPVGIREGAVAIDARTPKGQIQIGEGEFGAGFAAVRIPCSLGGQSITIVLSRRNEDGSQEVLASRAAEVLPQGPDCL